MVLTKPNKPKLQKSVKIPRRQSESVYRRRTDNTMTKRRRTDNTMTSGAPEGKQFLQEKWYNMHDFNTHFRV